MHLTLISIICLHGTCWHCQALFKKFVIVRLFPVIHICLNVPVIQIPVLVMLPLPMRSYFHSATKKVLDHLRAWWRTHHKQFTEAQFIVQHLVEGMTSSSLTMPTVTLTPIQTLVKPTATLFQVEFKTNTQSWLGLASSHLMRWRCFISVDLFYHSCILVLNWYKQADQNDLSD